MMLIVGGVYRECCLHPDWQEIYGSGGRAASAIAQMGQQSELHGFVDAAGLEVLEMRAALEGFACQLNSLDRCGRFTYTHGLATPSIQYPVPQPDSLSIKGEQIICYGMLEIDPLVHGDRVVYDPQNVRNPKPFHANGSSAKHLALVLNSYEAKSLSGASGASPFEMAREISAKHTAEVVVIKQGAFGALVYYEGVGTQVPAYRTNRVWKVGSGDTFVAHFGYRWICCGVSPVEAAQSASKATAYYCETQGFPDETRLQTFSPAPITPSERVLAGHKPNVYLAGPFFTLAQRWLIEEARSLLRSMGLEVFSPLHDVGRGAAEDVVHLDLAGIRQCDLVFAIGDGLDAGTIYEIGYARALGKPVVLYCENESEQDRKMMQGSDCMICSDFTTAIYHTLWKAISL